MNKYFLWIWKVTCSSPFKIELSTISCMFVLYEEWAGSKVENFSLMTRRQNLTCRGMWSMQGGSAVRRKSGDTLGSCLQKCMLKFGPGWDQTYFPFPWWDLKAGKHPAIVHDLDTSLPGGREMLFGELKDSSEPVHHIVGATARSVWRLCIHVLTHTQAHTECDH